MYSPKISEDLVPLLYRMAREQRIPMTRLVDGFIRLALAGSCQSQAQSDSNLLTFPGTGTGHAEMEADWVASK